jgi:saccharopine dehydrogenase (NAD+, L-lysine forming)
MNSCSLKIGIIKEGKIPKDERTPFSPQQCQEIKQNYPQIRLVVQRSRVRRFKDEEYAECGIELVDNVDDCDVLLGVKEVPTQELIKNKIYFFFSHTIKQQPHNRDLLRTLLAKNITMIDYECLTNNLGFRLIGFGRYAGIVGCYNTFYAYGKRMKSFDLKRAYECKDRAEMESELTKVKLPNDFRLVMTGDGRVANGVLEIISKLQLKRVNVTQFLNESTFNEPVFVQLTCEDYNKRKDGEKFSLKEFFADPTPYESTFMLYAYKADMYISSHFWNSKSPYIFTRSDVKSKDFKIKVIGDISCDINGPVASTLRPSTIEEPLYGYDPHLESEVNFDAENAITVMAVDNLPCELPRDSSEDFGREFMSKILPHLLNGDTENILERATICKNANLSSNHKHLIDFVNKGISI